MICKVHKIEGRSVPIPGCMAVASRMSDEHTGADAVREFRELVKWYCTCDRGTDPTRCPCCGAETTTGVVERFFADRD